MSITTQDEVLPATADTPAAVEFLQNWDRRGPWALTSIEPDGAITTQYFYPDEADRAEAWIQSQNQRRNVYFTSTVPAAF